MFKSTVPQFLRQLSLPYIIMGDRAYNILLNHFVATYHYDIRVAVMSEAQLPTVRNQLLTYLQERHPTLDLVPEDKPGIIRILWHSEVGPIEIADFTMLRCSSDYILAPNGLRYGTLPALLQTLEAAVEQYHQEYLTAAEELPTIIDLTREVMAAIDEVDTTRIITIVDHIGEAEEIDAGTQDEVQRLLDGVAHHLITGHALQEDSVLAEFRKYDQVAANAYVSAHPLDVTVPRDLVIAVYQLTAMVTARFAHHIIANDKKNKYLGSLARLEAFYKGITNPYQYFSKYYLRLLEGECPESDDLEQYLATKFECRLLKQ